MPSDPKLNYLHEIRKLINKIEIEFTRHEKATAIAISHRQISHAFQFTICFCVNFEELQLTLTRKVTLPPATNRLEFSNNSEHKSVLTQQVQKSSNSPKS
jgi:hypothetical protein